MTHLPTEFSPRPTLEYPFNKGFSPEHGIPFEVAEGVFWLRVPLPISLDHINLWLLKDGDGWVIVDSGYDDPVCKEVWDKVFTEFCSPHSVKQIIITHYHPDHIGLAAWLAHRCECKIWITAGELDRYRNLVERAGKDHTPEIKSFIRELGFDEKKQDLYTGFFSVDEKPAEARVQKSDCELIKHGDELVIGEHKWQIVVGNGHSPEHACLYCAELETIISGDQALPRISSNISVFFHQPMEDPLTDWLESCARLRDTIPSDTLVLPSHQEPFYGLDLRMQQLIDDHHAQLNKLRSGIENEVTANSAHKLLFTRQLNTFEIFLATSETLAHINYLLHRKELVKSTRNNEVATYSLAG